MSAWLTIFLCYCGSSDNIIIRLKQVQTIHSYEWIVVLKMLILGVGCILSANCRLMSSIRYSTKPSSQADYRFSCKGREHWWVKTWLLFTQVDRCNSLLVGTPKCLLDRLQSVLNSAARLVCNLLHWLPVQYSIDYKLALLINKSLHGAVPDYLKSYCVGVSTSRAGARLWSEEKGDLKVWKSKTYFGDRTFSVAGPRCWNGLETVCPRTIRPRTVCPTDCSSHYRVKCLV